MSTRARPLPVVAGCVIVALSVCCSGQTVGKSDGSEPRTRPYEHAVTKIAVRRSAAELKADELSGLAWYGRDTLVLLPQNERNSSGRRVRTLARERLHVLTASKQAVVAAIAGGRLEVTSVPMIVRIARSVRGYDGFEAICFSGDDVYATIESQSKDRVLGYVLAGKVSRTPAGGLKSITFDRCSAALQPRVPELEEIGFESLLMHDGALLAFYEANGQLDQLTEAGALVEHCSAGLERRSPLVMPRLEYRLTDVTEARDGAFWGMNFQYHGRENEPFKDKALRTTDDPLVAETGRGNTHAKSAADVRTMVVERIVEMRIVEGRVRLTGAAPVQLVLGGRARNWEGLARLDEPDGFLLVADEHTVDGQYLVFVPR